MTPNLTELQRLAQEAIHAEWCADGTDVFTKDEFRFLICDCDQDLTEKECEDIAAFIAACSPSTILALVEKQEADTREIDECRASLRDNGYLAAHLDYPGDALSLKDLCEHWHGVAWEYWVEKFQKERAEHDAARISMVAEIEALRKDKAQLEADLDASGEPDMGAVCGHCSKVYGDHFGYRCPTGGIFRAAISATKGVSHE